MTNESNLKKWNENKWMIVFICVFMQLCLGSVYIWGIFQHALVNLFSWKQSTAAITFSLVLGIMVIGSAIGGMFQDKFSPRPIVFIGGILISLGTFLSRYTTASSPWFLWLNYGVIAGFGFGMIYTSIIACCQKWFPEKRGFISGLIVASLGIGGLVFTPIAKHFIAKYGVLETFTYFGIIFLLTCSIGSIFVVNPPKTSDDNKNSLKSDKKNINDVQPKEMLKTMKFYGITLTYMLGCFSGLIIIPFSKIIGINGGLSDIEATAGVMIISVFNSLGRLFWGTISDKLGRNNTILILLVATAIFMFFLLFAKMYVVLFLLALIAFVYGGFLGVFPALTSDFFGFKNIGMNYGLVLCGFGIAALISPIIAGYVKDITNSFNTAFIIAIICSLIGLVIFSRVKKD